MKIKLDAGAFMPVRAHATDAGADIRSPIDAIVPARGSRVIDTGVHIQLPHGYVGMLKSKSGMNVKHDITSEGVIDEGYTGSIKVKLYNHGDCPHTVFRGHKITQLVVLPCEYVDFDLVDDLEDSERGGDGFGSTGK
nr:MAG TPA: dUTPase [Caudoviricetes sp.]